jgi:hypothetical protein
MLTLDSLVRDLKVALCPRARSKGLAITVLLRLHPIFEKSLLGMYRHPFIAI